MTLQTTANIWHNGKLIPWDQAQIHVMSHVVHYGVSPSFRHAAHRRETRQVA